MSIETRKFFGIVAWTTAMALFAVGAWILWSSYAGIGSDFSIPVPAQIGTLNGTTKAGTSRNTGLAAIPPAGTSLHSSGLYSSVPPVYLDSARPASAPLLGAPSAISGAELLPDIQPIFLSNPLSSSSRLEMALHPSTWDPQLGAGLVPRNDGAFQAGDRSIHDEAVRLERARRFVMCMCADLQGNVWVGTEREGVQRFNLSAPKWREWTQFTKEDGLADDVCYAVACDHRGRIWVGHLNHGVSVYNGVAWQTYGLIEDASRSDILAGPIGERVFAIKVCPTNGDVWIATNAGLTRYSEEDDAWQYYTRADGLPSDQVNSIAFDRKGNIYISTQCDGIAIAESADKYSAWRCVKGADILPSTPFGIGLPTNSINDLAVTDDGIVVAATTSGLAWSADEGHNWQYQRGIEWADKVRELAAGPSDGWEDGGRALLAEDYINRVSKDVLGNIFIGYRDHGWGKFSFRRGQALVPITRENSAYDVTAFPSSLDDCPFAGTYGSGVIQIGPSKPIVRDLRGTTISRSAGFPSSASTIDAPEFSRLLTAMAAVPPDINYNTPFVLPLDDDWLTEGAWLGRYGKYWCLLAAMDNVYDGYVWGAGGVQLPHSCELGPHRPEDHNTVRFWIAQNFFTDDYRALEIPPIYMHSRIVHGLTTWDKNRRQAEWDDNGEKYSPWNDGPGLVLKLRIPDAMVYMSLYEVNDDAQSGTVNRRRDFRIKVMEDDGSAKHNSIPQGAETALAESRVVDFWGGVYKRFLVRGPLQLKIQISREYSTNTIFNGIFLDLPEERPVGYYSDSNEWDSAQLKARIERVNAITQWQTASGSPDHSGAVLPAAEAAQQILTKLQYLEYWNPRWFAINGHRLAILLARWYEAHDNQEPIAPYRQNETTAFYLAGLYSRWEYNLADLHIVSARDIERSLRWDGLTVDNSGLGYEAVRHYLSEGGPIGADRLGFN
jgi:hypothetical protein